MSEAAFETPDWLTERIDELRRDERLQTKIARIREGVSSGAFVGRTHTRADLERLADEP